MSEHTPGPWTIFADKGAAVCILPAERPGEVCSFEGRGGPEREADARLIAAAPELLEACKLYWNAVDLMNDGPDDSDVALASGWFQKAQTIARAAIAKAESRS